MRGIASRWIGQVGRRARGRTSLRHDLEVAWIARVRNSHRLLNRRVSGQRHADCQAPAMNLSGGESTGTAGWVAA